MKWLPKIRHAMWWRVWVLASIASLGCGPGPVEEEQTWMLGMFSSGTFPCSASGQITRYVVHDDGRFEIIYEEPGYVRTWNAQWEQRGQDRIRVMRDDANPGGLGQPHPILPGTEWEVKRSFDCVIADSKSGYNLIWHDIDRINLDTGHRSSAGAMTPGVMCIEYDQSCGDWPLARVTWCEGTEPPPDCAAE